MSKHSLLPHGHQPPERAGALATLIADAVARSGSLRKAAAAVTDAAWDMDRKTTTIHPSTVSDWLAGAVPHRSTRRWIAAGLQIPLDALTRAAEAQQNARRAVRHQRLGVRTPGTPVDSEDVERREFTRLLAMASTAMAGFDLDRYAAVLAGTRADQRALDDFERITLDLIRQEPTVSPQSLMPAVRGHLAGLRDLLVWAPPALAPRAHSLAGQTALLAGYLWYQQDNHAEADGYWSLAERFGDMAGDARLRAALLELRASGCSPPGEVNNLALALALLDHAVKLLGPNPEPAIAAYILSFRARQHAEASGVDSAHATQAMRDLDDVQTYLGRMPSADAGVYIVGSVTGEALQGQARALVHLGRPSDAVTHLDGLLASVEDGALNWRAGIMLDLATAHAAMGEGEHASDLLSAALQAASQAAAGRKLNRVRQYRQRWLSNHDGPALRRLDDQLRSLPAAPAPAGIPSATTA
jgi:hypothetical protein